MPCDSSHMNPHTLEIEMSKVVCILEEVLDGVPINKSHFAGYHPFVYCKMLSREKCDMLVSRLCRVLSFHKDVGSLSLEAQVWWRDHKEVDRLREEKERLDKEADKPV